MVRLEYGGGEGRAISGVKKKKISVDELQSCKGKG